MSIIHDYTENLRNISIQLMQEVLNLEMKEKELSESFRRVESLLSLNLLLDSNLTVHSKRQVQNLVKFLRTMESDNYKKISTKYQSKKFPTYLSKNFLYSLKMQIRKSYEYFLRVKDSESVTKEYLTYENECETRAYAEASIRTVNGLILKNYETASQNFDYKIERNFLFDCFPMDWIKEIDDNEKKEKRVQVSCKFKDTFVFEKEQTYKFNFSRRLFSRKYLFCTLLCQRCLKETPRSDDNPFEMYKLGVDYDDVNPGFVSIIMTVLNKKKDYRKMYMNSLKKFFDSTHFKWGRNYMTHNSKLDILFAYCEVLVNAIVRSMSSSNVVTTDEQDDMFVHLRSKYDEGRDMMRNHKDVDIYYPRIEFNKIKEREEMVSSLLQSIEDTTFKHIKHKNLGNIYFRNKDFTNAIHEYKSSFKYLMSKQNLGGRNTMKEIVKSPKREFNSFIFGNICAAYIKNKNYKKALKYIDIAIYLKEGIKFYKRKITCVLQLKRFESVVFALKKVKEFSNEGEFKPILENVKKSLKAAKRMYLIQCGSCKRVSLDLLVCEGCKKRYYCDAKCQKSDWPNHQNKCQ